MLRKASKRAAHRCSFKRFRCTMCHGIRLVRIFVGPPLVMGARAKSGGVKPRKSSISANSRTTVFAYLFSKCLYSDWHLPDITLLFRSTEKHPHVRFLHQLSFRLFRINLGGAHSPAHGPE